MNEKAENIDKWKEKVQDMKEFELFLAIESFGCMMVEEEQEYYDNQDEISFQDLEENIRYYVKLQDECILMLSKFGIDPESKNQDDGDYWKWYYFWKIWLKRFTKETWEIFHKKMERKEPLDEYLPKDTWNTSKEIPDQIAKKGEEFLESIRNGTREPDIIGYIS